MPTYKIYWGEGTAFEGTIEAKSMVDALVEFHENGRKAKGLTVTRVEETGPFGNTTAESESGLSISIEDLDLDYE